MYAESKCRRFPVGKVPWCPQITKAIACILYWKGIKRIMGSHIGAQYLQHLTKHRGFTHQIEHVQLDGEVTGIKIKQAYQQLSVTQK